MEIPQPFPVTSDGGGTNKIPTGQLYHATSRDKMTDSPWRQLSSPLLGFLLSDRRAN